MDHAPAAPSDRRAEARRLLIVLPQPFFEDRGTSIALNHVVRALSELGQPVDFLSFSPGRRVEIPGVNFIRARNPLSFDNVPIGFSLKKLILDAFLFTRFRRQVVREDYAGVYAVEEAAYMAGLLRRRRGLFVIYDMASSLPEQLAQYQRFKSGILQRLFRRSERWALNNVDLVVCSAGLERRVRLSGTDADVRTWRYPSTLIPAAKEEVERLRAELGLPTTARVVLYIGSFARYQGLESVIGAVDHVLARVPEAVFLLVGADGEREIRRVYRSISSESSGRVIVRQRVPRDAVPVYLGLADVLLAPRSRVGNLSLKVFEYLDAGKPIIASDIPAHRDLFADGSALVVERTAAAFGEAVLRVLSDSALAARLSKAAKEYSARNLAWPQFVELVDGILREVPREESYE